METSKENLLVDIETFTHRVVWETCWYFVASWTPLYFKYGSITMETTN